MFIYNNKIIKSKSCNVIGGDNLMGRPITTLSTHGFKNKKIYNTDKIFTTDHQFDFIFFILKFLTTHSEVLKLILIESLFFS